MERLAKKQIRMSIIRVLDSRCQTCMMRSGHNGQYCLKECEVTTQLQKLSSQLPKNENVNDSEYRTGKWSNDEEFYLLNHMDHYSIEHLSRRLNRDPEFVCNKKKRLIARRDKKGIS